MFSVINYFYSPNPPATTEYPEISTQDIVEDDYVLVNEEGPIFVDQWDALIANIDTYLDTHYAQKQLSSELRNIKPAELLERFKEAIETWGKKCDPSNYASKSDRPGRWELLSELKDIVSSFYHEYAEKWQTLSSAPERLKNINALEKQSLEDMEKSQKMQALMSALDSSGSDSYLASEQVSLHTVKDAIKLIQAAENRLNEWKLIENANPSVRNPSFTAQFA
ncbi:hypothetical protein CAGGBEG34_180122 [Candidatus Glomeribacter gigasporarum BEG34]|uniref:Uncharacterized protein n=1 Tax=Candidatus Glomeribacter gigasporarum BEG34 TaxID=1070319 RepID=G2J7R7_9BURK|nr:hypothetical protein [Candidatus Glomeribacter gigasporarum]CCD28812.1 hypothetical protein CAGGBEG34_180122 [Candidatus Glomeribacter gigasporarum BEG34]